MPDLAKVLLAQPEQRGSVELRVPAHIVVRVWMELLAVPIVPDLLGVVLALRIDSTAVPVVLLSRDVVAAFQQQDAFARGRQMVGQGPSASAAANNDDVIVIFRFHAFLLG